MFMSYHAADDPDVDLPWFQKKIAWIIAAVVVVLCFLAVGVGIFIYVSLHMSPRKNPDVRGGLTIEADPNTRIYFGDRQFVDENEDRAVVYLLWPEIIGDEKHRTGALQLPDANTTVTPEMVSGAGAKLLVSQGIGSGGSQIAKMSGDEYWIRRADGSLDHV